MSRKVCVVTATRAEYGLLKCLLDEITNDPKLDLQLIVTGSHLSPEFGYTVSQIEDDGYPVAKYIEILLSSDSSVGVNKGMGLAQISFAEAYAELKPDIVVVLGDRYELIPIVSAATLSGIPVAHLNGGEITEGAVDDAIRHAITKLSHLHFTAIDEYARRVIRMGEQPARVFNVGEAGLDSVKSVDYMSKAELEQSIGKKLSKHNYLITFHPETYQGLEKIESDFYSLLKVLGEQQESLLIFTKANADVGGRLINKIIDEYAISNNHKTAVFSSLGQRRYLSLMRFVDAVVGNSSSGIVEAPSFKVGTINIGDRQKGRIRSTSVIDVDPTVEALRDGFATLHSERFKKMLLSVANPYDQGNTSRKIKNVLRDFDLSLLRTKVFYDGDSA